MPTSTLLDRDPVPVSAPRPASEPVARFEKKDRAAPERDLACRGDTGEAATDDDHVLLHASTTRASRPTAPSTRTSSGLTSTSAISGCAAAKRDSAATARAAAATSSRRAAAGAEQQRRGDERANERLGRRSVDRRERDRDVAGELGVDAAGADDDERPEARVAARADEQLEAGRHVLCGLDRERLRSEPGGEVVERGAERSLVAEAEGDAAGVGLVQERRAP